MTEKTELPGLTRKALVVGMALAIVSMIWFLFFAAYPYGAGGWNEARNWYWSQSLYPAFPALFGWPFIVIIGLSIVNAIKPVFNRQEVAIILVMTVVGSFIFGSYNIATTTWGMTAGAYRYYGTTPDNLNRLWGLMPNIWGPKDAVLMASIIPVSTWAINWGLWAPTLVQGILFLLFSILMVVFASLFYRRLYVDHLELAFPVTEVHSHMVELTQPVDKGRPRFFKSVFFWIGFLISFLWAFAAYAYPGIYSFIVRAPASYTLDVAVWGLMYDWTPLVLIPWVPLIFNFMPYFIGWGYLMSIEVIIGVLLGFVAMWVVFPMVLNSMGNPLGTYQKGWPVYTAEYSPIINPNVDLAALHAGLLIGLALMPLLLNRGVIIPILKSITGKAVPKDADPNAPMDYRYVWLLLVASFLIFVASWAWMDIPMLPAFLFTIVLIVCFMGAVRVMAETGGLMGHGPNLQYHHTSFVPLLGTIIAVAMGITMTKSTEANAIGWWSFAWNTYVWVPVWIIAACIAPYSFQLGKVTNVVTKDMLKSILYAIVITVVLGGILYIIYMHVVPITNTTWDNGLWVHAYYYSFGDSTNTAGRGGYFFPTQARNPTLSVELIVIGIVVIFALSFLRMKVPAFRVSIAGLVLGMLMGEQFLVPFVIALIAKWLTIRVGGVRLYEEKGKPIAMGLFLGYMLVVGLGIFPMSVFGNIRAWLEFRG